MCLYIAKTYQTANSKTDLKSTGRNVICTFCQATTQMSVCFVALMIEIGSL